MSDSDHDTSGSDPFGRLIALTTAPSSPRAKIEFGVRLVVEREWRATVRKRRVARRLRKIIYVLAFTCIIAAVFELARLA